MAKCGVLAGVYDHRFAPLLALALSLLACKDDAPAPPAAEVTVNATFDDRALGVFFAAPDPDFALVTGDAARGYHADAVVALDKPPKCKGFVTVTPLAGRTPEAAAKAAHEALDLTAPRVVQDEELLYCGKTGWRVEVWGDNAAGEPAARRITFLPVGERLYGVYALADGTIHARMRRCLDQLTAAFEPTGAD